LEREKLAVAAIKYAFAGSVSAKLFLKMSQKHNRKASAEKASGPILSLGLIPTCIYYGNVH